MSQRYKGGIISATPPTTSQTAATGVWTMEQQMQAVAAGNWPPNGPYFVEDVFSTYLYTGNGSTQTITNGIDLAGEGGLVWGKARVLNAARDNHFFVDTVRGAKINLASNTTGANQTDNTVTAFNNNGFTVGLPASYNTSTTYASWTFRKAEKFFDVVTYSGTGSDQVINHGLNSTPGCIIIKRTNGTGIWLVWHDGIHAYTGETNHLTLNDTAANTGFGANWIDAIGSSSFTIKSNYSATNESGGTYVAYLFAHDAGGFGDAGDQNVITCGSYTGNGSTTGPTVTLGYEPQWLMIKTSSTTGSWQIIDNMRGMVVGGNEARLLANSSSAELSNDYLSPTATGFQLVSTSSEVNGNGQTYIYIAIRRGPMKTPTSATSIFKPQQITTNDPLSTTFPVDLGIYCRTDQGAGVFNTRLTSTSLYTYSSSAEIVSSSIVMTNNSWTPAGLSAGYNAIYYGLGRAPGFMDVVCYTGTGSATTQAHNLGVAPELMFFKIRNASNSWVVYNATIGATKYLILNSTAGAAGPFSGMFNDTAPTSSVFTVGTNVGVNQNTNTYVAYLFATVSGVSKVGSYTGTGNTLQINCGFTNGSRFVLIKRSDSTGDWYYWDSSRGIVAGNDPYLLLNAAAAQVTTTDWVDTYSLGFELSNAVGNNVNINTATYIFLAIA